MRGSCIVTASEHNIRHGSVFFPLFPAFKALLTRWCIFVILSSLKCNQIDRLDVAWITQFSGYMFDWLMWFVFRKHTISGLGRKQPSVSALSLRIYWFFIESRNNLMVRSKRAVQEQDRRGLLCAMKQKNILNTLDFFAFPQRWKERYSTIKQQKWPWPFGACVFFVGASWRPQRSGIIEKLWARKKGPILELTLQI